MKATDSKKLDHIITMLGDMIGTFGKRFDAIDARFDKLEEKIDGVDSKVAGINRRLDAEAIQRTDLRLPRRVHDLEEEVYGAGRSKHPKHLPL